MKRIKIFLTAYIQVCLIAIQTVFLARNAVLGVAVAGFLISFVWTFNVRNVAFSGLAEKLIYSSGASLGGVSGLLLTKLILLYGSR